MAGDVDKELAASLQLARKKPQNFVMVALGTSCVKLLLSKKPIREGEIQKARKETKGNRVFRGVCEGGDGGLIFKVSEELPSVKEAMLKTYIAENAGLPLKVRYELVTELAPIDEEGAETEGEESPGVPPEVKVPSEGSGTTEVDDALLTQLADALAKLAPAFKAAMESHPQQKQQLLDSLSAVKAAIDQKRAPDGKAALTACVQLLKQVQGEPGSTGVSLVKLGRARLEWIDVRQAAIRDFQSLRAKLAEEFKDDQTQTSQLSVALQTLDGLVGRFDTKLQDELDAVLNASVEERPALIRAVRSSIDAFARFLDSNPVMAEIDGNEVLPGMQVKKPLEAKLAEISAALGS